MKLHLLGLIVLLVIIITGCQRSANQTNFYFDASSAFSIDKIALVIKINDNSVLDTVVKNLHINHSLLLKSLNHRIQKQDAISVTINGKNRVIKNVGSLGLKCMDVFLGYDDHSLIFKKLKKVEFQLGSLDDSKYKQLFDSIRVSSGTKYHEVLVRISRGKCNNYSHSNQYFLD